MFVCKNLNHSPSSFFRFWSRMAPKESRTFLFTFVDFGEQVVEVDVKEGDTDATILEYLKVAFPTLKEGQRLVKGFYEGSPTGVYKPFHRVRWMNTPAMTQFFLDVASGRHFHASEFNVIVSNGYVTIR